MSGLTRRIDLFLCVRGSAYGPESRRSSVLILNVDSGKVTTTIEAERRALLFINPGRKEPPYTTDTTVGKITQGLCGDDGL